ncbi:response regulator [Flavobacterium sp. 7A]|uniref:response regulator n=1 Tax=Flavobacterium sp. 7A TaxID=2940571 RepID=UPI002225DC48|nr:response regulator [Flavobacterium sp. 7A]MCW2119406.1 CRP-like cAMP-binding protein/ActR/RegA family two-component response regulator [Flavobacterium sp. 7A]
MSRILLIEDNTDVRENTAEILTLENYEVITAENGKIGIQKALEHLPDIIICDIMMPELDGYGVFENLSVHPKTANIPFIYLTAKSEKRDIRKGMNLGVDDYLIKPFEEEDLLGAISCRLKKKEFLQKEFSKNILGFNAFFNEASQFLNLEDLSKNRRIIKYKNKEEIFTEGSAAHQLYFIQSGNVKTYRTTESGKEFVIALYGPGDFIGQLSLLSSSGNYAETASVMEDAEVLSIPKDDFTQLLYGNKEVSNKFFGMISNNIIELQEQLVDMAFATVRQRTAKALLELDKKGMMKDESHTGISIPREDFAGLIGTATETAIRMLTAFKNEGLIAVETNRRLVLLDKKKIRQVASNQ